MKPLRHDPIGPLLAADDAALRSMARRELLGETTPEINTGELAGVRRIVARQQPDGRWKYPGGNPHIRSRAAYDQLETYRQLGVLVCKFGLDRHASGGRSRGRIPVVVSDPGRGLPRDLRPPVHAELLRGHHRAPHPRRIRRQRAGRERHAMAAEHAPGRWRLGDPDENARAVPRCHVTARETFEPDRSRPSSHLITGIVLRALAAHPGYRHSADTRRAANLVKSRFFRRDVYPDRAAPSNWLIFSYPFWWTDLLSALNSLARIGFRAGDPDIARGVAWFTGNQEPGGLWNTGHNRPKGPHSDLWVGLAICRMLNAISA